MSTPPTQRLHLPTGIRGYRRTWLRPNVVAGLTVWAVLIPESLAYATIAGVSPVIGLYAAVPSLVIYALLGSSRLLVVAPMSASAALSASIAATYAAGDDADYLRVTVTLALVTGLIGVTAGLLRLGFLSAFISEPVLRGFIIGLALTILVGQVPALVGVEKPDAGFFERIWVLVRDLPDIHLLTATIGIGGLAVILVLRRLLPIIPASLVVVALGIAASAAFDLADRGVGVVGTIASGLPSIGLPDSGWSDYTELVAPAAGVLLVAYVEGLAAAKAYAARNGDVIDPSREIAAVGAANIGSGLVGAMVVSGSLSKTAVNAAAGARSQLSTMIVSGLTILTLLFLTGLFEQLPHAILAAVVIAAVVDLIEVRSLRQLYGVWSRRVGAIYSRAARADFIAAVGALLGVLVFDVLPGLIIGVCLSLVLLLYRTSRPHVARLVPLGDAGGHWVDHERHPDLPPADNGDVVVARVEGPLFFGNADEVERHLLRAADGARALVLDAETVSSIDVSASAMLEQVERDLTARGVLFLMAAGIGQVRDIVEAAGYGEALARHHRDVSSAVAAARAELAAQPPDPGVL